MKYRFLFILLFLSVGSFGQTEIFGDYNFEEGNFSLVFLNVEFLEEDKISFEDSTYINIKTLKQPIIKIDSREHYILEHKEDLSKIKSSWKGVPVDYMYMCWYDYFIYLLKDGDVISEMRANFECKELLVDGVPYEFDSTLITSILPKGKRVYKIELEFDSIKEGREFYNQTITDPELLMKSYYRPTWVDYNGQFRIEYLDYEKNGEVEDKISMLMEQSNLRDFKLKRASIGIGRKDEPNDYTYRVFCNEQPENISGLTVIENWKPLDGPFKVTFLKRNTPGIR